MREQYTKQEAIIEANRCLNCNNPQCIKGCPLANNIPQFIQYIKIENFEKAYETLLDITILSEVCSRVCPVDKQCVGHCIRGIKGEPIHINTLEQFVADYMHKEDRYLEYMKNIKMDIEKKNIKVAIIGAGPSGIACAYYLIKKGYDVTIFEKESFFGGILSYGIPDYRLPKDIVKNIEYKLIELGVDIQFSKRYGKDITEKSLLEQGYKAIFLGIGLHTSSMLNVEGKELANVYSGNEFLYAVNGVKNNVETDIDVKEIKDKNVVVVGGGNVAIDSAISAKKIGAKNVTIVYRRTEKELLIEKDEKELADKEQIKFEYLALPVRYTGHDKVQQIECVRMKLGDIDSSGRRTPIVQNGTNFNIDADYVIVCVGSKIDVQDIFNTTNLDYDDYAIKINEYGQTNIPYIFAGGDICLTSNKTVAMAAHSGIISGMGIDKYLEK